MDPAKRICLKNLPENCTKREVAELVRNRTGIQPHSIDLGLKPDGHTRSYAHFSCENTKNVLEILSCGVKMRDNIVYGYPAKPHFMYKQVEARRKREREEEQEEQARNQFWEAYRNSALARFSNGPSIKIKPPKPFYAIRQKYSLIASQIANTYRHSYCDSRRFCSKNVAFNSSTTNRRESVVIPAIKMNPIDEHVEVLKTNSTFEDGVTHPAIKKQESGMDEQVLCKTNHEYLEQLPSSTPELTSRERRKLSSLHARLLSLGSKIYKKG